MSEAIVHVGDETFADEVLNAEGPVLVDFWRRALALLESGQIGNVNEVRNGYTILYQAVLDREIVAIAALLRHGADPNFRRWLREIRPVSPRAVRCHAPAQFARSGRRDLRHL